jgi:hypothetical protein
VRRRDSSGALRVILIREDANVGDPPPVTRELRAGEHILGARTPEVFDGDVDRLWSSLRAIEA